MRSLATETRFTGREGDYSDFTYHDTDGSLTRYFAQEGFQEAQEWLSSPPTYHIEVKSTTEDCNEPFFVSNNQMQMVCGLLRSK